MCAHAVRVAMKNVKGVDTVEVSLNKGLATVTLKEGNTATMKQLREAIAKNGFTTKQSRVVVDGVMISAGGSTSLRVSSSGEVFPLTLDTAKKAQAEKLNGKTVRVEGTIPEAVKGKVVDSIAAALVTEKKGT